MLCLLSRLFVWQVVGIDALQTREVRRTHELFHNHLMRIRQMPMLKDATAVLCLESNLAFESQHLIHYLQKNGFQNWLSLSEGARGELGFLTTASTKERQALMLREALKVGKVSFTERFFSLSMTCAEAKERLSGELRNFSVIKEPGKSFFSKPRITYSGKLNGMQDDCVIVLQLSLLAQRTFFESPKYERFAAQSV